MSASFRPVSTVSGGDHPERMPLEDNQVSIPQAADCVLSLWRSVMILAIGDLRDALKSTRKWNPHATPQDVAFWPWQLRMDLRSIGF